MQQHFTPSGIFCNARKPIIATLIAGFRHVTPLYLLFDHFIYFKDVAFLDVIEFFKPDTALVTFRYLFNVILETGGETRFCPQK